MINISEIVLKTQHHNEVPGKAQQKFVVNYKVSFTVLRKFCYAYLKLYFIWNWESF